MVIRKTNHVKKSWVGLGDSQTLGKERGLENEFMHVVSDSIKSIQ